MGFKRIRASALALGLAAMFAGMAVLPALAASSTVVVTPQTGSWAHKEQATATGAFVTGPGTPPAGIGSYKMTTGAGLPSGPNNGGKAWLSTNSQNGTDLAAINSFSYSTYVDLTSAAAPHLTIALQLQVDLDGNGTRDTTMVFEPVYSPAQGPVTKGIWQTWDVKNGNWWFTTPTSFGGSQAVFPSFAAITMAYPNAQIVQWFPAVDGAGLQLVAGQNSAGAPWTGFIGAVDNLKIGVGSDDVTYNFEPYAMAQDKDDCKNGGWQNVRRADGSSFKNQGDCVSYTKNGK